MSGYEATLEGALHAQIVAIDATALSHMRAAAIDMLALVAATRYPDLVRRRGATALARRDAYDDDFEALRQILGSFVTHGEPRLPALALERLAAAVHRSRRAATAVAGELSARFAATGVFARAQIAGGFMTLHSACERQCAREHWSAFSTARYISWRVDAELQKTPRPPGGQGMDTRSVVLASDAEARFEPSLAAELADAQHAVTCETQWVCALALERLARNIGGATDSHLVERLRAHVETHRPKKRWTRAERERHVRAAEHPEEAARVRDAERLHALVNWV